MVDTNLPPSQRLDPYAFGLSSGHSGQEMYSFFLGPPPRTGKDSAYSKKPTSKWNMPESYIGESEYLRDTVEDWNFTANQTWYTQIILPYYRTDEIHVHWEQWENNPSFMEQTPHQAASHIVTQMRSIKRATLIRRGIGAEFEHDFIKTALGRTSFVASLAQIGRSFQETMNVEVIRALLNCHRSTQVFVRKFQVVKDGELDKWLERKADRFMCAQKNDFGLEKLNTEIEAEQEKFEGASANVWIMGREVVDYLKTAKPEKTLYWLGGQEAVDRINNVNQGPKAAGGTMGNLRSLEPQAMFGVQGIPVYLAKSYVVDSLGQLELLSKVTEVGVFNTMIDHNRNYYEYKTESRNIRVYNEDLDDWAEITIEEVIDDCIVWAKDGTVDSPFAAGGRGNHKFNSVGADEDDFLRIPRAGVKGGSEEGATDDIKYVGDIHPNHFKLNDVIAAGATVYQKLKTDYGTLLEAAVKRLTSFAPNGDASVDAKTKLRVGDGAFKDLDKTLQNLLGSDNLFFLGRAPGIGPAKVTNANGDAVVDSVWSNYLGNYGAKKGDDADPKQIASSLSSSQQEDSHAKFLNEVLGAPVPQSLKPQLAKIVSSQNETWEARAQQIESLLVNSMKEDSSSVPALGSDHTRVRGWFDARVRGYQAKLERDQASSARLSGGNAPVAGGIEYFPIGTPLPAGYEYASARDAERARSGRMFPKSLAELDFLPHLFVNEELQMGGIRRAAGFANVGGAVGDKRAVGRGDDDLVPSSDPKQPPQKRTSAGRLSERFYALEKHIQAIESSAAPLMVKWLSLFYLGSQFTRNRLKEFAQHNLYIPCGFLLLRPHATYKTRYGIKCASGGKSGYTFMGHSDMQIAHDGTRKVGVMHYTVYAAPVVHTPKNVYVVEDLFCENYLGGMGVKIWKRDDYLNKANKRTKASIIVTMLPPSFKRMHDRKIDIRGKFYNEFHMNLVDPVRMGEWCYPGAARTATYMNWWDPVRGTKAADKDMRSRTHAPNWICWQGVQWEWNVAARDWGNVTLEQGNFGNHVQPGCGQVRKGKALHLEKAYYLSNVSQRPRY